MLKEPSPPRATAKETLHKLPPQAGVQHLESMDSRFRSIVNSGPQRHDPYSNALPLGC